MWQGSESTVFDKEVSLQAGYRPTEKKEEVVAQAPLPELPPSPWRSLGRIFDYQEWPDRERFLELDRQIVRQATLQPEEPSSNHGWRELAAIRKALREAAVRTAVQ